MFKQILLALVLTGVTVMFHALGTVKVVFPFGGIWTRRAHGRSPVVVMPLTRLVSGLLVLHLIEMGIWAAAFAILGIFPDFETSLYFSLTSYSTVGYGDVVPPQSWRLVGPLEAAVGVLMLGWSTGVIVAALQRLYNRHLEPPETEGQESRMGRDSKTP